MASVTPWLQVADADAALEFYRRAWGAVVLEQLDDDGHVAVALLSVDGAEFWVQSGGHAAADAPDDPPVRMILTVADPHAAHASAVAAGATEIFAVGEGNGWLVGRLADPSGHHWEVGHRLTD
ncbi:VOC family protein [Cellulomonas sp. ICMP 17802]|uniref:VOC family protein n=1 Tax=Cellulomonas sp. ICMP 17802 TaxID=3239199 RepID=UPI00351BB17E